MKAIFTLTAIIASALFITAKAQSLPIDEESGHVVYEEVVNISGASAEQLYNRALKWVNTFYTNPSTVIQSKDAEARKLTGKHGVNVYRMADGKKYQHGKVRYYVDIMAKEGRYKFRVYEIYFVASPKLYIEKWTEEGRSANEQGYAAQVDEFITKDLIVKLKERMAKPLADAGDDDW